MADYGTDGGYQVDQVLWGDDETPGAEIPVEPRPAVPQPAPQAALPPVAPTPLPVSDGSGSIKDQSHMLAATVVSTFTDRLKSEAQKRGGYLTVEDIDRLSNEFDRKRGDLEKVFELSFAQFVRARERAAFDHARQYPFDRLIVNTFAGLFARDRVAEDGDAAVTRRVLPGFFIALDKMLGAAAIEELHAKCRKVVARLADGSEAEFNWELLYGDAEAQVIGLDALISFAPYFEDINKRKDWFVPLINGSLDSSDEWALSEAGYYNLVAEMFSPLRQVLADKQGRANLERRIGGVAVYEISRSFERMDKAVAGGAQTSNTPAV